MCYFEQTQYLGCGHNVEMVMEKCELGEKYRTSMHDKIITALHTDDGKCEKCNPPPAYIEHESATSTNTNGATSDLPEAAPNATPSASYPDLGISSSRTNGDLIDLTDDKPASKKRRSRKRKDSIGEDLMDLN